MSIRFLPPLTLLAALALVAVSVADDTEPEPPGSTKGEVATPAVDLDKLKTDKKLAALAARNEKASVKNLMQIGIAFHSYHDTHGVLPDDIADKKGKPLHNWRVAILPHLGEKKLYEQFKLDEPWDSRHNVKLLAKMPDVFRSPRVNLKSKSNTVYQVFTGPNAVFGRGQRLSIVQIPDGTSNTIMVIEATAATPWTKPGGIPFARNAALPDFSKAYGKRPLTVLCDGTPRIVDLNKVMKQTLVNAIDPADGFPLGNDW